MIISGAGKNALIASTMLAKDWLCIAGIEENHINIYTNIATSITPLYCKIYRNCTMLVPKTALYMACIMARTITFHFSVVK